MIGWVRLSKGIITFVIFESFVSSDEGKEG
jgi:hypothetical protein